MNSDYNAKKPQTTKNKSFYQSVRHALVGLVTGFKEELNLQRDLMMAALAIILGIICRLHYIDWLFLILAIFIVLLAEFWNTVVEHFVDLLVEHQFNPTAKKIKDISAASVLLSAVLALAIGAVVFGHAVLTYL